MAVVGITGRKHHGKDTLAQHFVARGFVQMRFADPLKEMLRAFYRCVGVDLATIERKIEGDLKEVSCPRLRGHTPREAMQTLGTEWGRVLMADDLWVNALQHRALHVGRDVVVSDVRFDNECAAIKAIGGVVVRVDASKRVPANEFSDHPSEVNVDTLPSDGIVDNNGPEFYLKTAVDQLLLDLSVLSKPHVEGAAVNRESSRDCVSG